MTQGGEDSEGGRAVAQGWVSHHASPYAGQLLLLRFGLVVLDGGQRRGLVGVQLPLAGAHGDCESEVGLKGGHNPRQVALSLSAWRAHLGAAKLAMAACSMRGNSSNGAEIGGAKAKERRG